MSATRNRGSAYALLAGARRVGSLAAVVLLIGAGGDTGQKAATHEERWMVTDALTRPVAPPWMLIWMNRPIWFEGWNAAGNSESTSRRIELVGDQLLTVMRKRLYALESATGSVRWSLALEGDEIFDWKIIGRRLIYSSVDYRGAATGLRAGLDLERRDHAWQQRGNASKLFDAENITVASATDVVFAAEAGIGDTANHLVAVDAATGRHHWTIGTDVHRSTDMRGQRFSLEGQLYSFVAGPTGSGLSLRRFSLVDGGEGATIHVIGTQRLGKPVIPTAVRNGGLVFAVYPELLLNENPRFGALGSLDSVFAYSIPHSRLLWTTRLLHGSEPRYSRVKKLALGGGTNGLLLATLAPDAYAVLDPDTGAIRKRGQLPGYVGWSDFGALLYAHPYVYAGARRARGDGTRMVYDLIALDVDKGTVAWRYELDGDDRMRSMARAEILNFIVSGKTVFVARADGMIMRFESARHEPQK
jgi:outer membrane protein assembly factor BamB